jgi:hypothetical protein
MHPPRCFVVLANDNMQAGADKAWRGRPGVLPAASVLPEDGPKQACPDAGQRREIYIMLL